MQQTELAHTLLRISYGMILFAHGYLLKVQTFTIAGTVGFFESLGLPAIAAYLVIFGEVIGGLALIFGLFTRLAAWLSLPIMLGAIWPHVGNGWVFSAQGGGWEFPAILAVMAIVIGLAGPGRWALDHHPSLVALRRWSEPEASAAV